MATKEKLSMQEFAEAVSSLKDIPLAFTPMARRGQIGLLDKQLADLIRDTNFQDTIPATLVYALSYALHNAEEKEKVADYWTPIVGISRAIIKYARIMYSDKEQFLNAPYTIGMRINDMRIGTSLRLSMSAINDAISAPDYSSFYKIYSNVIKNLDMPAREFIDKFGGVSIDKYGPKRGEMRSLHRKLASEVLWPYKPEYDKTSLPDWFFEADRIK